MEQTIQAKTTQTVKAIVLHLDSDYNDEPDNVYLPLEDGIWFLADFFKRINPSQYEDNIYDRVFALLDWENKYNKEYSTFFEEIIQETKANLNLYTTHSRFHMDILALHKIKGNLDLYNEKNALFKVLYQDELLNIANTCDYCLMLDDKLTEDIINDWQKKYGWQNKYTRTPLTLNGEYAPETKYITKITVEDIEVTDDSVVRCTEYYDLPILKEKAYDIEIYDSAFDEKPDTYYFGHWSLYDEYTEDYEYRGVFTCCECDRLIFITCGMLQQYSAMDEYEEYKCCNQCIHKKYLYDNVFDPEEFGTSKDNKQPPIEIDITYRKDITGYSLHQDSVQKFYPRTTNTKHKAKFYGYNTLEEAGWEADRSYGYNTDIVRDNTRALELMKEGYMVIINFDACAYIGFDRTLYKKKLPKELLPESEKVNEEVCVSIG